MFEPLKTLKTWAHKCYGVLLHHRALYAALAACHGWGCVITDKPELYGLMAALYALLACRG